MYHACARPTLLLCLCASLGAGCSDDDDHQQLDSSIFDLGGAVDTATAVDLGGGDLAVDAANKVLFSGVVIDFSSITFKAVANAKVCLLPSKTVCATSATDGKFQLLVPSSGELALEVAATGYTPFVLQLTASELGAALQYGIPMSPTTTTAQYFSAAGVTVDSSKGIGGMLASESSSYGAKGVAGVSFAWTPAAGGSVIYMDASGLPDKTLTSTSSAGYGAVANVPPGDYVVTTSHATKSCAIEHGSGWSGTAKSTFKVTIHAGKATGLAVICK